MSPARPETLAPLRRGRPSPARRLRNAAALAACWLASAVVILPLALIVWHLLEKGLPALNLDFFLHMPKPVGEPGGGMANAIVGTLVLVGLGAAFAVPVGVGAGVWLAEYGRGRLAALVRYTADVLAGVPSIVVGVVAYGLVVVPMGRFSALAGGVALGILMLPTLVRSTEEVVLLVPRSYREASLALGATGAVGSTYNYAAPVYQALIYAYEQGDAARAAELQALAGTGAAHRSGVARAGAVRGMAARHTARRLRAGGDPHLSERSADRPCAGRFRPPGRAAGNARDRHRGRRMAIRHGLHGSCTG